MAERPDLRKISGNIREALAEFDREALLEVLTYVFKEYVVEGPPPMLISQHEQLEDLAGLSFAQLIGALQTRLEHPELELFHVEGQQVTVRAGGTRVVLQADNAARRGANTLSAAESVPTAAPPGVQFVDTRQDAQNAPRDSVAEAETRGRGDLAGGQRSAQRPVAGLSVTGRRAAAGMMDAQEQTEAEQNAARRAAATGGTPAPAGAGAAAGAAKPGDSSNPDDPPKKGGADDDDASIRFSLLELE